MEPRRRSSSRSRSTSNSQSTETSSSSQSQTPEPSEETPSPAPAFTLQDAFANSNFPRYTPPRCHTNSNSPSSNTFLMVLITTLFLMMLAYFNHTTYIMVRLNDRSNEMELQMAELTERMDYLQHIQNSTMSQTLRVLTRAYNSFQL